MSKVKCCCFLTSGLRTLCMAVRVLTEQQYEAWEPGYYRASVAVEGREKLIEEEAEKIEKVGHREKDKGIDINISDLRFE